MTTTTTNPAIRNGVDTAALFTTLNAVKAHPELADFQFRATNRWVSGTHSRSTIQGFYGAMQEDASRTEPFVHDYWEEVFQLSGTLTVGGKTFGPMTYACRPPQVFHGPFRSDEGCLLLEVHYYDPDEPPPSDRPR